MRIEYDRDADALYISLQDKEVYRTVEISEGVNADLDEQGRFIGLEVLDAADRYSLSDIFDLKTENLFIDDAILSRLDIRKKPSSVPEMEADTRG
ncbi:MAG: DUF2283 domain-containing protein [Desulfoferrobacter sp.]